MRYSVIALPILALLSTTAFAAFGESKDNASDVSGSSNPNYNAGTYQAGISDYAITHEIQTQLRNQYVFGSNLTLPIKIETTQGIVHLTGIADSQDQVDKAVQISRQANGVKNVTSDIKLKSATGQ